MDTKGCNEYYDENISYHYATDNPLIQQDRLHTHELCEIYCVFRGNGYYMVEGSKHKLEHGKIFLMRPGEFHKSAILDDGPYERVSFHFTPSIVNAIDTEKKLLVPFYDRPLGKNNVYSRSVILTTGIYNTFREMNKPQSDNYFKPLRLKVLLFSVLLEISELFSKELYDKELSRNKIITEVIEYINAHLTDDLSVNCICEKFFISRSLLNRNFKNAAGTSVWDYIITKRLALARAYIADGMNVTRAAEAAGFRDYSNFYRAYLKKYSENPTKTSEPVDL